METKQTKHTTTLEDDVAQAFREVNYLRKQRDELLKVCINISRKAKNGRITGFDILDVNKAIKKRRIKWR